MNPIRPTLAPSVQPSAAPRPADAVRSAAQRAFFELALGKAPATAAAQTVAATAPTPPLQRTPNIVEADAPKRPLRPGSLLDIRV